MRKEQSMNQIRQFNSRLCLLLGAAFMLLCIHPAHAQWKTESFRLKPGWNAIFLHVDAKYADLTTLVSSTQISEVWLWTPSFDSRQFITSPDVPTNAGSNWLYWQKSDLNAATLQHLIGNAAYLIKFDGPNDIVWEVQGIPVPPVHKWSSDGENFIGFSTPEVSGPDFEALLAEEPALASDIDIFQYIGGDLASNPVQVLAFRSTPVTRGQAFWMKAPNFNSYFHPFDLDLQQSAGIDFVGTTAQYTVRVRNRTDGELSVTLNLSGSDSPPENALLDSGDPSITPNSLPGIGYGSIVNGTPPVVIRGALDSGALTFPAISLSGADYTVTLAPEGEIGSTTDVVLGIDLTALGGSAGDLYAGIIRFTDSLGHAAIDVPVRIVKQSKDGLWVGEARVNQVMNSVSVDPTQTFGATSVSAPLRLILHHGTRSGLVGGVPVEIPETQLLQRIYFGLDANSTPMLAKQESQLESTHLDVARRITAVHLPWTEQNNSWVFNGLLDVDGALEATVTTGYNDQASNPFLHTYHPDHDNKNPLFDEIQPRGEESYQIERFITLSPAAVGNDFESVTRDGNQTLEGDYEEDITIIGKGTESKQYSVKGGFSLTRLSIDLPLTTP
jgi:hypothetical protein